jgi:hypothetical protein
MKIAAMHDMHWHFGLGVPLVQVCEMPLSDVVLGSWAHVGGIETSSTIVLL